MSKNVSTSANTKRKGKSHSVTIVRRCVQVLALVLFAAPLLAAGWGLFGQFAGSEEVVSTPSEFFLFGSFSSSTIGPVETLDPFAMLQVAAASKTFDLSWIALVIPVLLVYGLIRGRAFCGWICSVNLLGEMVDWLRGKLGIKVIEMPLPRHTKVFVALGVLVLSALVSMPVFELISPVSALSKLIAYGSTVGLVTLAAVVVVELFWGHRVWCRSICPLGGFYEVVGKVGLINIKCDHEACIGCQACKKACLCDPEILQPVIEGSDTIVRAGDCMLCGKCTEACPTSALSFTAGRK